MHVCTRIIFLIRCHLIFGCWSTRPVLDIHVVLACLILCLTSSIISHHVILQCFPWSKVEQPPQCHRQGGGARTSSQTLCVLEECGAMSYTGEWLVTQIFLSISWYFQTKVTKIDSSICIYSNLPNSCHWRDALWREWASHAFKVIAAKNLCPFWRVVLSREWTLTEGERTRPL